jgi:hypothetical protein
MDIKEKHRIYMRKWNARNREKVRAMVNRYRKANPEKVKEFKKRYYLENKEKLYSQSREWRKKHPGKAAEYNREYRARHRDRVRIASREHAKRHYWRNADKIKLEQRIRHALGKDGRGEYRRKHLHKYAAYAANRRIKAGMKGRGWIKAMEHIYERARELSQWFDVVVDHIIPIAKGGLHTADNLQIIYRFENAKKAASLSYKPSVVFI